MTFALAIRASTPCPSSLDSSPQGGPHFQCPSAVAGVPPDHCSTGIRNTIDRSGASLNAMIGEPDKPAPHALGSASVAKNIRCGRQCASRWLRHALCPLPPGTRPWILREQQVHRLFSFCIPVVGGCYCVMFSTIGS